MIRISALNEESDDESESEKEEVTREALEEIALQQYVKVLEMQRKGDNKDSLKLLKDLLDTELLYNVEKPLEADKVKRPLLNLKYLCYRNIASLSSKLGDNDAAIDAYLSASELDDSDVTLWFRLGKISLECEKFELASYAFQRGVDCNPKHWPCIDNLITVLLGLGNYNDCIANIYNALKLDPEYFRGRTYRKHIFTDFPYILEYLRLINPIYKWESKDDENISGEKYDKLLKEAYVINDAYIEHINKNKVIDRLPVLPLNKPIEKLTWLSLGESLTDMHVFMTKNALSHACVVEISQPVIKTIENVIPVEKMDVDFSEIKAVIEPVVDNIPVEDKVEVEKVDDVKVEPEKTEQIESEAVQEANKSSNEGKDSKKPHTRRRGSSLSFLEQWEWCTKRRSSRKKPVNRQDRNDETIYETLKRVLPQNLLSEDLMQKKSKDFNGDESLDTMDIYKLFEEKEKKVIELNVTTEIVPVDESPYFGSEKEITEVENFITKYVNSKCDIITMLDEFVLTLSKFWTILWPENLGEVYTLANKCTKQHYDPPMGYCNSNNEINNFVNNNLMHLEIEIAKFLRNTDDQKGIVDIELLDVLKFICPKYEGSSIENLVVILRYLWVKCHAHLHEDKTEFAIDCLYRMLYELNGLADEGDTYTLLIPNFINKSIISKSNIIDLLKSLERNKLLSTVLNIYEAGRYEEILPILQDSFKHCQVQANKQEWSEMGLDWAVHLVMILEILWALENNEQCFTWAVICLHEALKQYLICPTGTVDYEKWSLTVIKILMTIEHILKLEGCRYLDILPEKGLAHLVQDITQIIVHQIDDLNGSDDMPLKTVVPWILLHYILQREEDCGRSPKKNMDEDAADRDDIPPSLMILFTAHNYLGKKGWCGIEDGALLHFIFNTVIPRLRSPALLNVVESVSQHLEQVVFCLFGHPSKKTKNRYLYDHNAVPQELDWNLSQHIFELYRPYEMPEFNSYRLSSITAEIEQLFQRMLKLLPSAYDPVSYAADVINYIENRKDKLPESGIVFPYKIRDIYYLLADFYFKNNETVRALRYYAFDIVISSNRFDSWAGIALARASLLETKLNSCETFKTEMEYLNRAAAVERCFKKALEIDSSHSILWIEYGAFVYGVHSFCSRMLKQASESLSMENFEVLEKRKDDMLNTAHRCFISAHKEWLIEYESEDKALQDERWLHYYMLGKIAEKKGEFPSTYLQHYIKAGQHLLENNAMYPLKINYNNPQNLSVEALEIHYRIHASILKYIVHHENKKILMSVGKAFKECLAQCAVGPFSKKKQAKDGATDKNQTSETPVSESNEVSPVSDPKAISEPTAEQPNNIKRTLESTDGEEVNCKKPKLSEPIVTEPIVAEDVEKIGLNENSFKGFDQKELVAGDMMETACEVVIGSEKDSNEASTSLLEKGIPYTNTLNDDQIPSCIEAEQLCVSSEPTQLENGISVIAQNTEIADQITVVQEEVIEKSDALETESNKVTETIEQEANIDIKINLPTETRRISQESTTTTTVTSKEETSSDSSSDSSSDDSSSDSTTDSSNDTNGVKTDVEKEDTAEMSYDDICEIISICLDNLEECVSRFPQHYKALYRLAHYHFYYKKDKNVGRCKELMMGSFMGRNNVRMQGLFTERKNSNFFSGIWRIPASEVDRPGSFASHMSRCVLITMEILKEVDDHKILLDLSLQLQRTPDAEKKYLRDSERSELSQQSLSLCTRSIKGLYSKFNQPLNVLDPAEKKTFSTFMLDVYKSYQKVQKHMPSKSQSFSSILIDCYKLINVGNYNESANLLDASIKHCHSYMSLLKQQSNNPPPTSTVVTLTTPVAAPPAPKKPPKTVEPIKPVIPTTPTSNFLPTLDLKQSFAKSMYAQSLPSSYMSSYAPLLSAISLMGNIPGLENATANYSSDIFQQLLSSTNLASSYYQQFQSNNISLPKPKAETHKISKSLTSQIPSIKRQMSTPNATNTSTPKPKLTSQKSTSYMSSFNTSQVTMPKKISSADSLKYTTAGIPNSLLGHTSSQNIFNLANSSLQVKPAHQPVTQTSSAAGAIAKPAHMTTTSTVNAALHTKPPLPHQQVSPGKTLQEKLAEKQKQNPNNSKILNDSTSPRNIPSSVFSGKIPSSLTITKSVPNQRSNIDEHKQLSEEGILKKVAIAKKSILFDHSNKPKNVDPSEIIILDDD